MQKKRELVSTFVAADSAGRKVLIQHYRELVLQLTAEGEKWSPTGKIILTGDKVTDEAMTSVARLLKLKTVRLKNTSVTAAGLAKIGGTVALETLDLSGSKNIGDDAVAQIQARSASFPAFLKRTRRCLLKRYPLFRCIRRIRRSCACRSGRAWTTKTGILA